jgi:ectoine hydroxylase-related dioxygenase (phytanoyl-CoA dioxygenase family)
MTAPWRPGRWQTVTARRHTRESVRRLRAVALHAASSSAVNAPAAALGRHPSSSCAHTAAAAAASAVASVGMTELGAREKFMLDLQGFLVLPAVLSAEEVQALNNAVDASWDSAYTDSVGDSHPCRIAGHQSRAFNEMRGMLEWDHPHCQPFRELLAHPKIIPCMNTLHGRGWRMDHSPFLICGDGTRVFEPTRGHRDAGVHAGGNTGGFIHGHPWDPEYRYHYANGVMRSGHVAIAFQLTDVLEDWGGFGIIPGSHKVNFPLPAHLATTSLTHIAPPLVCPAARAGDLIVFFESALHASLPW